MSPSDMPEPSLRDVMDAVHRMGVIIEQIPGQFRALHEGLRSEAERLDRRIDALEKAMSERFEDLTRVVRQNSLDIRSNSEDIKKNSEDIHALRCEITSLRYDFDHRSEMVRVSDLEGRVAHIERRLGIAPR